MGEMNLTYSDAKTEVISAIKRSETTLLAYTDKAVECVFNGALESLEASVRLLKSEGTVNLKTPCWTRHLEPELAGTMSMAKAPTGKEAAIYLVALYQEATMKRATVAVRQEEVRAAEVSFLSEKTPAKAAVLHEKLSQAKLACGEVLSRVDQIEADIKWLSLAVSVDVTKPGKPRDFLMDDPLTVPLSSLEEMETTQDVYAGNSPRKSGRTAQSLI